MVIKILKITWLTET